MGNENDEGTEMSMRQRIESLEARVALLEEQLPTVTCGQSEPLEVGEIEEAERDRASKWTMHYTVTNRKENIGAFFDHKWQSSCTVTGYVIDAAGRTLKWNHVTVGFNRGCNGSYPKSEEQDSMQNCDEFYSAASLRPKIDHWSGWVECRGDHGVARFQWKTKNCG
ncbi:MAG: hypothetical protein IPK82_38445 [Polyangiaceae bacterium]|nr:hypothetical protein [Polyangiaceae bacterium]